MTTLRKALVPILLATAWIIASEFVRNEFLVKSLWLKHYESLHLTFPSTPLNGAVWGLWSLLFAVAIYIISTKFSLVQTALLSWLVAFVMMWIVLWNLAVLPEGLLLAAVPLSLLESFVAAVIVKRFS